MQKRNNMLRRIILLISFALLLTTFNPSITISKNSEQWLGEGYVTITPINAKQMIDYDSNIIILDVRDLEDYNLGHINDAVFFPFSEIACKSCLIQNLGEYNEEKIIVYCKSGQRSEIACEFLAKNGFDNVYDIIGGIDNWIESGYSVNNSNLLKSEKHPAGTILMDESKIKEKKPILKQKSNLLCLGITSQWDWRNAYYGGITGDWTTSVKNQDPDCWWKSLIPWIECCGSCWGFAAMGALESTINIREGLPDLDVDLSEQYLLSCPPDSGGCQGWYPYSAYSYLYSQGGAIPEQCFPYQADDTVPCSSKCADWYNQLYSLSDYGAIYNPDREYLKQFLIDYGPFVTSMKVYSDFSNYNGGVYEHETGEFKGYHAVVVVGYNDDPGYWICKNSWGTDWGENGWFKIKYGDCDIEHQITWADYEKNPTYSLSMTIHRIKEIDSIDSLSTDWYYDLSLYNGQEWVTERYICSSGGDVIVDKTHVFEMHTFYPQIRIKLMEDDFWTDDDLADVSSEYGGGTDDSTPDKRGAIYYGYYNLAKNALTGDVWNRDWPYYIIDGSYDGSWDSDENDARLWFTITDNYWPPTADFHWTPENPTDLQEIDFLDDSYDEVGAIGIIVNWSWNFGDGNYSFEQYPRYQYADDGEYDVTLSVRDDDGLIDTVAKEITIYNVPPIGSFDYSPLEPYDLQNVTFTDSSFDPDGDIINWTWYFGDGNMSYEQNPIHIFGDNGIYTVILTIRDNDNTLGIAIQDITVKNIPPTANFIYSPADPIDLDMIQFNDTSVDVDGAIKSWSWNFGDGNSSTLQNPIHQYADNGEYIVSLIVTDNDDATNIIYKEINVSNAPPTANFVFAPISQINLHMIVFNDTSYDLDGFITNWTWDFGDGNISYEKNATHQYRGDGEYSVALTVIDNDDSSNNCIQKVTIDTTLPVIQDVQHYPEVQEKNKSINITCKITDNIKTDEVFLHIIYPDGAYTNFSIKQNSTGVIYYCNQTYSIYGNYSYFIWVNDTHENSNTSNIYKFVIKDISPPEITNIQCHPVIQEKNKPINITCNVVDNTKVSNVKLNISNTNAGYQINTSMTKSNDNLTYFYNTSYSFDGIFDFYIWMNDQNNNENASAKNRFCIYSSLISESLPPNNETMINATATANTTLFVNVSELTDIWVGCYENNPVSNMADGISAVGKFVEILIENKNAVYWPITVNIYYTQEDLINCGLSEDLLKGVYFWNDTSELWELYNDTGVNTTNQNGYEGYCWANVRHLTLLAPGGGDTEPPSKVTDLTVSDAKDGKLNLAWNVATDNIAIDQYRIYRNGAFVTNVTVISYQDTGLTDGQSYSYEVSAVDTSGNEGNKSDPMSGTPAASQPTYNQPPSSPPPPSNNNPTANANGPYYESTDVRITFDGSGSADDGTIESYDWDFGDGNTGTGVSPTHTYTEMGNYTVTLTVTDDGSKTDIDATYAIITGKPNIPPEKPEINGTLVGHINTNYSYSVMGRDQDGDNISYILYWGDGANTTSDFLANGTIYSINHKWAAPGIYFINVYAMDKNNATSETIEFMVLIDVHYVSDVGYLIDNNSDGIYDSFYSNVTGNITSVEKQDDGKYLIDCDEDGEWNYIYDLVAGTINSLGEKEIEAPEPPWLMITGILVVLAIVVIITFLYKKEYF